MSPFVCRPSCSSPTDWAVSPRMDVNTVCSFHLMMCAHTSGNGQPVSPAVVYPRPGPRPVEQRGRQSRFRLPGFRERARVYLVGEQPDEPADALE